MLIGLFSPAYGNQQETRNLFCILEIFDLPFRTSLSLVETRLWRHCDHASFKLPLVSFHLSNMFKRR